MWTKKLLMKVIKVILNEIIFLWDDILSTEDNWNLCNKKICVKNFDDDLSLSKSLYLKSFVILYKLRLKCTNYCDENSMLFKNLKSNSNSLSTITVTLLRNENNRAFFLKEVLLFMTLF